MRRGWRGHEVLACGPWCQGPSLVEALLREHTVDTVVHFAAESHVDRSIDGPGAFIQTNVVGTLRLLNCARLYWTKLPAAKKASFRFLHVSTDEVYGTLSLTDPAFTEETPFAPNSPYAASKASSDHLVRSFQHTYHFPTLTTNCSNNYGPYQFPEKLMPLMILNGLEGKQLPVYGKGANVRDWLHVDDHARALALVFTRGRLGQSYNIGGRNERTNLAVVEAIADLLDREMPLEAGPRRKLITFVGDRPGHELRYARDASKSQGELGWRAKYDFETGLAQTFLIELVAKAMFQRGLTRLVELSQLLALPGSVVDCDHGDRPAASAMVADRSMVPQPTGLMS